jgi:hypothetical protein
VITFYMFSIVKGKERFFLTTPAAKAAIIIIKFPSIGGVPEGRGGLTTYNLNATCNVAKPPPGLRPDSSNGGELFYYSLSCLFCRQGDFVGRKFFINQFHRRLDKTWILSQSVKHLNKFSLFPYNPTTGTYLPPKGLFNRFFIHFDEPFFDKLKGHPKKEWQEGRKLLTKQIASLARASCRSRRCFVEFIGGFCAPTQTTRPR